MSFKNRKIKHFKEDLGRFENGSGGSPGEVFNGSRVRAEITGENSNQNGGGKKKVQKYFNSCKFISKTVH